MDERFRPWGAWRHHTPAIKATALNEAQGTFRGYAAVFRNLDQTGDIIEPGAFTATLAGARARKATTGSEFMYPLLWMHDTNDPVGGVTVAREDYKGLYIEGRCDLDTASGTKAFNGLKSGYANGFSIGYRAGKATRDNAGVRHLITITLFEISVITAGFSANDQALVEVASVKSVAQDLAALTQEMRAWRAERSASAPPPRQHDDSDAPPPDRADFQFTSDYHTALDRWIAERYARALPHPAEVNARAFAAQVAAQRAQRIANGTATLSERLAAAPVDAAQEAERARIIRAVNDRIRAMGDV